MRDEQSVAEAVVPVIAAVIAFLDTDVVFNATHARTVAAKEILAARLEAFLCNDGESDPPILHLISGGGADPTPSATPPLAIYGGQR